MSALINIQARRSTESTVLERKQEGEVQSAATAYGLRRGDSWTDTSSRLCRISRQVKKSEEQPAKILVVDDESEVAELLSRLLMSVGYECRLAHTGEEAAMALEQEGFDLLLCDIIMPGMSGMDLLTIATTLFPDVAVLMVTGVKDQSTAMTALELGAYGYIMKPSNRDDILINVASALDRRRLTLLSRQYERALEEEVQQRTQELLKREEEIVFRLGSALGYRDNETGGHCRRVGLYSALLAKHMGWDQEGLECIRLAAPLHDIGKIAIPDSVLLKPGPLTPGEFEVVKKHCHVGAALLEGSDGPIIRMAREIALSHHERWDGSGYPMGLQREAIPESGRIVAISDVYDSLVRKRPYRSAFSEEEALSIMIFASPTFDPEMFDVFLEILPQLRAINQEI